MLYFEKEIKVLIFFIFLVLSCFVPTVHISGQKLGDIISEV